MKVVAISDTHGKHREIDLPEGDLLVHAGDITWRGELDIMRDFDAWCGEVKSAHGYSEVLLVAGNHDFSLEGKKPALPLLGNCRYLEDAGAEIAGVRFWGSPWTPRFLRWAFMKEDDELGAVWERIPADTDVLITHGPPRGVLDRVPRDENVGSETLRARVETLAVPVHVFGHIHEGSGTQQGAPTLFVNASICDAGYEANNPARVFDVQPRRR